VLKVGCMVCSDALIGRYLPIIVQFARKNR